MTQTTCQLCKRDISKPSMVRCTDNHCPLKAEAPSGTTLVMKIGLAGLLVVFVIVLGMWMFATPAQRSVAVANARQATGKTDPIPSAAAPAAAQTQGSSSDWLSRLFVARPRAEAQVTAGHDDQPDAAAATRVQNFACNGDLPASRAIICTHWDLATTDYNLSLVYRQALARTARPDALRRAHARWLAELDRLGADAKAIARSYDDWRAELDRS